MQLSSVAICIVSQQPLIGCEPLSQDLARAPCLGREYVLRFVYIGAVARTAAAAAVLAGS